MIYPNYREDELERYSKAELLHLGLSAKKLMMLLFWTEETKQKKSWETALIFEVQVK